jgi:hypothetical protein
MDRPVTISGHFARTIVPALAVALAPLAARAQVIPDPPPTPSECRAIVAAIGPANPDGKGWYRIGECGAKGIAALRGALWSARRNTDSLYLPSLIGTARRVRHARIFEIARKVATAPSTTNDARIMGLLVLLNQYDESLSPPFDESWAKTTSVPGGIACRLLSVTDVFQLQAGALPADSLERIAETTEALMVRNYSAAVRDLAGCVRDMISEDLPLAVPKSAITLTYLCGNKFRVANSGPFGVTVAYKVVGTDDESDLSLRAGQTLDFYTFYRGTLHLTYQNRVIRRQRNRDVKC